MKIILQNTAQFLSKPNLYGFFKPLIVGLVLLLLFYQVHKLELTATFLKQIILIIKIPYLLIGIFLVIPNYYFEILKWKMLGQYLEPRSFKMATVEVLRGLKLGLVTPLMVGDYIGRSLDFKKENKVSAILLNLINSYTQTWTALLFGSLALSMWWYIADESLKPYLTLPAVLISISAITGLALLYNLRFPRMLKWEILQPFLRTDSFSKSIKTKIVALSVLRTLVYNLQYICFYKAFGIILPSLIYFIGVNTILLIKTVGGGLNVLGDLSLRQLVSINFFGWYDVDQRLVLVATFVIWFVNVFSPVVFGIFYKPRQ